MRSVPRLDRPQEGDAIVIDEQRQENLLQIRARIFRMTERGLNGRSPVLIIGAGDGPGRRVKMPTVQRNAFVEVSLGRHRRKNSGRMGPREFV